MNFPLAGRSHVVPCDPAGEAAPPSVSPASTTLTWREWAAFARIARRDGRIADARWYLSKARRLFDAAA